MKKEIIGFIGQGWIGKNYANDFEDRGLKVVRYSLEEPYIKNKDKISKCDIVFIAVPTPTTPQGFDDSILREAIKNIGKGNTAVIKSTILPGTTDSIQKENPDIFVMHSPEFLTEATAARDAANPNSNIIGIPLESEEYRKRAKAVLGVLPRAPYENICGAAEAELIKYGRNSWFYFKVVFSNLFYDLAEKYGADWKNIKDGMVADPRVGHTHFDPAHKSGRGAGGHCFIKDFEAFRTLYEKILSDKKGQAVLDAIKNKNIDLLISSNKDRELLKGVYGEDAIK